MSITADLPLALLGYSAMHRRLRLVRGRAAEHPCATGCGAPGAEWAYDHKDPAEALGHTRGRPVAYSLDVDHYQALCKGCHARADRGPQAPVPCSPAPVVEHAELVPLARPTRSLIDLRKPKEVLGVRRRCPLCEMVKDLGAFGTDRRQASGRRYRCRSCDAAEAAARYTRNPGYSRSYYERNRDRIRSAAADRRDQHNRSVSERNAEHRRRAIQIYGGCCVWCGSTEDLEFDHPNNDGTAHRVVESITQWVRRVSKSGRPDPTWVMQLLCVPCHSGPGWKVRRAAGVPAAAGGPP